MNLILIGYRGTGKSTIARLVAERLAWPLVSTDAGIEADQQASIPEIVARSGWDHFRQIESTVLAQVTQRDQTVIDTGGGIVERSANIALLRKRGFVIWLTADIDTIIARISGDPNRPPLTTAGSERDEVAAVLARRTPLYRQAAHYTIDTASLSTATAADAAATALQRVYAGRRPTATGATP